MRWRKIITWLFHLTTHTKWARNLNKKRSKTEDEENVQTAIMLCTCFSWCYCQIIFLQYFDYWCLSNWFFEFGVWGCKDKKRIDVYPQVCYHTNVNNLCVLQSKLRWHTLLFLYFVPAMPLTVWSVQCGHFLSAGRMPRIKREWLLCCDWQRRKVILAFFVLV